MIKSTLKAQEAQSGYDVRNLTSHSTGARVSVPFIENLSLAQLNARPVNSGVRFLLNDEAQTIESADLNFTQAADLLNAPVT
jgi:hypothetical protein